MKKKTRWSVYLIVIFILLTAIITLGWLGINHTPDISEQIPEHISLIDISILHPLNQTGWPANYPIPIDISAYSVEAIDHIDLYINNTLYESKDVSGNSANNVTTVQWKWQPGDTGMYVLTARATGVNGSSEVSNPVIIQSSSPISTGSPIQISENTTLEQISDMNHISLVELKNANPEIDVTQPVEAGAIVFLPNLPDPVINKIIPAFNPDEESDSTTLPEIISVDTEKIIEAPQWNKFNDLGFFINKMIKNGSKEPQVQEASNQETENQNEENQSFGEQSNSNNVTDPSKVPEAIEIYGSTEGCNVNLYVAPSYYFAGVFIYRSKDGGPFERIAKIPHYTGDQTVLHVTDENQSGIVVYYAAAFNTYGENPGPAKTFSLSNNTCGNTGYGPHIKTTWLEENGDLSFTTNLDTAYLYVQINNGTAERVPDHDRMFLENTSKKFNLNSYLETRDDLMEMTDFDVHMEIWGWQAGELIYVGNIDQQIHRSMLLVCDTEGEGKCSAGNLGHWSTEMTILPNIYIPLNEQKYELRWLSSNYSYTKKICIRIADKFTGPDFHDSMPTILHLCFSGSTSLEEFEANGGTYLLDFGELLYHDGNPKYPVNNGLNDNYQEQDYEYRVPMGEPFTLAIRVLPIMADNSLNDSSNTVYMHHLSPYEQEDLPPMASSVPSLYDIEILENTYKMQEYEIPGRWACVIIDANPPGNYDIGQEVCPLTYVECGVNVECEDPGFFGTLEMAWNLITNAYNDAKGEIAGAIVDTIPYCEGNGSCEKAVRAGVDYGTSYLTGMPPNLPNSDELVAEGVSSVIAGELEGVDVDPNLGKLICGDSCEAEIAAQVRKIVEEQKLYYDQPGCFSYGDHYGYFPVCFGPPTVVHPVYGAYDYPGYVFIRVTRKSTPESLNAADILAGKTQLWVTVDGENRNRIGYFGHECHFSDNVRLEQLPDPSQPYSNANRMYTFFGDEPMQGQLYKPVRVDIPWLEPGESIEIPISLYVIHNQAKQNCITTTSSQYLFYRGTSHMEAAEYCLSEDSSQLWVPCSNGGLDTWDYDNPQSP